MRERCTQTLPSGYSRRYFHLFSPSFKTIELLCLPLCYLWPLKLNWCSFHTLFTLPIVPLQIQKKRRDLRLIVASATLDAKVTASLRWTDMLDWWKGRWQRQTKGEVNVRSDHSVLTCRDWHNEAMKVRSISQLKCHIRHLLYVLFKKPFISLCKWLTKGTHMLWVFYLKYQNKGNNYLFF